MKTTIVGALFFIVLGILGFGSTTPRGFDRETLVTIPSGVPLTEAAQLLAEADVVHSTVRLLLFTRLFGGASHIKAGDYFFEDGSGAITVALRLIRGLHGLDPVRTVIPEGTTVRGIAEILGDTLDGFDTEQFLRIAERREGLLFPDTYFFLPNVAPEEVVRRMEENFEERLGEITPLIEASPHTLADIIVMASLVEKEARTPEDMALVAGVLWERIRIGMALQVDAPFFYLFGKTSRELSLDDLALDSPYNTYNRRGLPPTPIANPGLVALSAAANPTESDFLYYLSDSEGIIHYAENFDGHQTNRERYLR